MFKACCDYNNVLQISGNPFDFLRLLRMYIPIKKCNVDFAVAMLFKCQPA